MLSGLLLPLPEISSLWQVSAMSSPSLLSPVPFCNDRHLYHSGLSFTSPESTNYHLLHCQYSFCHGMNAMAEEKRHEWLEWSKVDLKWAEPGFLLIVKWMRLEALVTGAPQKKPESMVRCKGHHSHGLKVSFYVFCLPLHCYWRVPDCRACWVGPGLSAFPQALPSNKLLDKQTGNIEDK